MGTLVPTHNSIPIPPRQTPVNTPAHEIGLEQVRKLPTPRLFRPSPAWATGPAY